jgi:hypothetical protein
MKNQVLTDYLFYLVPAAVIPLALHLLDNSASPGSLVKIGLLIPLCSLAMKGLAGFFPDENLAHRSMARMAEYAALQGLVLGAFMVILRDLIQTEQQSDLVALFLQLIVTAATMAGTSFVLALRARKRLKREEGLR